MILYFRFRVNCSKKREKKYVLGNTSEIYFKKLDSPWHDNNPFTNLSNTYKGYIMQFTLRERNRMITSPRVMDGRCVL